MERNNIRNRKRRRDILKKTAFASGPVLGAGIPLTGTVAACDEDDPDGDYEEKSYTDFYNFSEEMVSDKCKNGANNGTKMEMSKTDIYWCSAQPWGTDEWQHFISTHSYCEHSVQDYTGDCSWSHATGLDRQQWSGRNEDGQADLEYPSKEDNKAVYPPEEKDDSINYPNTVYTGIVNAIDWGMSGTTLTPAELVYAMWKDSNNSNSSYWDLQQDWKYENQGAAGCMGHYTYVVAGSEGQNATTVTTESRFYNHYYDVVLIETDVSFYYPSECDSGNTSTSSCDGSYSNESEFADKPSYLEGDIIELEGGELAEVQSVQTSIQESDGKPPIYIDDADSFRENYPEVHDAVGVPRYIQRFPTRAKATAVKANLVR